MLLGSPFVIILLPFLTLFCYFAISLTIIRQICPSHDSFENAENMEINSDIRQKKRDIKKVYIEKNISSDGSLIYARSGFGGIGECSPSSFERRDRPSVLHSQVNIIHSISDYN